MSLKYEPASNPLHISGNGCTLSLGVCMEAAAERRGNNSNVLTDVRTDNGPRQEQSLALTGSFVPSSLDSGAQSNVVTWPRSMSTCSGSETVAYLRLIDSCITQLKAEGPSRTCNESKEEEEEVSMSTPCE